LDAADAAKVQGSMKPARTDEVIDLPATARCLIYIHTELKRRGGTLLLLFPLCDHGHVNSPSRFIGKNQVVTC
jgi:hypothetical protein